MMAEHEAVDVVVVGGGAAGCVVAARLSESGTRSVALLEAGPDLRANLPAELRDGWRIPREPDWGYAAERDARGVVEELTRGKLLGGTSWMTRFALRGAPADYDEWAALGNAGWSFEDVLPYFTRLEADADFGDRAWHGDRGPLPISRYLDVELSEIAAAGLEALKVVGFPTVEDHNRPGAVGAGRMPMSSRDGTRVTTADAYLPLGETPRTHDPALCRGRRRGVRSHPRQGRSTPGRERHRSGLGRALRGHLRHPFDPHAIRRRPGRAPAFRRSSCPR
jgi:choline dehydrogenase